MSTLDPPGEATDVPPEEIPPEEIPPAEIPPEELAGRATAPMLRLMLGLTAAAAAFIGLVVYVGGLVATGTLGWFAWPIASPVTATLLGAGFVGAVPMLLHSITRALWEDLRVPAVATGAALTLLTAVTLGSLGDTGAASGSIMDPSFLLGLAWLLGLGGLTLGVLASLCAQLFEPALPLARTAPLPRWTLPIVALQGAGLAGLGFGLVAEPAFWAPQLPWQATELDARMLGAWSFALGLALLVALAEDDLVRVRGGLLGLSGIGALALLGLGVRHGDVTWSGWSAWCGLVLLLGMTGTGLVGSLLARRTQPPTTARVSGTPPAARAGSGSRRRREPHRRLGRR